MNKRSSEYFEVTTGVIVENMDDTDSRIPPAVNLDDIESRILILKRRAAEADFLREERDILLNRLRMCGSEIILPDVRKCGDEEEENEALRKYVDELNEKVAELERRNEELLQRMNGVQEELQKQNQFAEDYLTKIKSLQKEIEVLSYEKNQIQHDFDKAVEVFESSDPIAKCKDQIKLLCARADDLRQQRDSLMDTLLEREARIDVLKCKISQLETKRADTFLQAKIKLNRGEDLNKEEVLALAIDKLETANKTMAQELAGLKAKFEKADGYAERKHDERKAKKGETSDREGSIPTLKVFKHRRTTPNPVSLSILMANALPKDIAQAYIKSQVPEEDYFSDSGKSVGSISSLDSLSSDQDTAALLNVLYNHRKALRRYNGKLEEIRSGLEEQARGSASFIYYNPVSQEIPGKISLRAKNMM